MVMLCTGCHLCLLLLFAVSLAWKTGFKQVKYCASKCALEVGGGRHAESGIALSQEGMDPISGQSQGRCWEQHLGLRAWLGESFSALEDVEIVRKEKTTVIQFPLFSRRIFI